MPEQQPDQVPVLVHAGISPVTFLFAVGILAFARIAFFWNPKFANYHYVNAVGWLAMGLAWPRPMGWVFLIYGACCIAMGIRTNWNRTDEE
jgi:hypothetical protein